MSSTITNTIGALGHDWGIDVVVITRDAFDPGKTAQQLRFRLDYDHLRTTRETPHGRGYSLQQRAAVAPGLVRSAIEHALTLPQPFTGQHGEPDVIKSLYVNAGKGLITS